MREAVLKNNTVLILYFSRHGSVAALAEKIAVGVVAAGATAMIRTVPNLNPDFNSDYPALHPLIEKDELIQADALALGSPVRFGLMAAEMKAFWDNTSDLWLKGQLIDKPAGVFTSSSSMHGGNEATLLGMMLPLLHHGMVLLGIPYEEPALHQTQTGGTPYGPTHVSGSIATTLLSAHEQQLAISFGKRLATIAGKLS
ncbi:NAD(P)H:quinone oxidoreductase [Rheinheimera riviphila]|uniref:NAD(P)H:quinone oxidoreductase n=1 Tax=Rheinheimera riviphila TaxID=1834037 RepID=A0A437R3Q3_9GAMM|nr:NAD(P)H:quinone oxidoreductase [Rheinheimera riviphila]